MTTNSFPADFFERQDMSDDSFFYSTPRKVVHIDENAIGALTEVYRELLPAGGTCLDLMSSWRSHYPPDLQVTRVIGLGMNKEELRDNPQLDKYLVHNLNQNPHLPYESNLFDAVTCAVSVQYLTNPIAVFEEVNRVLKANGVFIVSFSNRCFPNKAVAIWMSTSDEQHIALVGQYFQMSSNWKDLAAQKTNPADGYPLRADPLYVVSARKV
ncbi:MAG: methyltransferase domain-containing protein [Anaerolineaceae bacterium]|nr:methyltransferase domain-containing protein [Anaerolineaceae bacterium]